MENIDQASLISLLSNLVLFMQVTRANDNPKRQSETSDLKIPEVLLSQFGNILQEKWALSEPRTANITQLFLIEDSREIVMKYVISVLKEAMERESEEGKKSTMIIETLIEHFLYKLSIDQKLEAEAELLSETKGMFYGSLLIDIFKIDETIDKTRSHRRFIRKSYERFSQFFPNVSDHQIAQHDMSKFEFVELIGYTAR